MSERFAQSPEGVRGGTVKWIAGGICAAIALGTAGAMVLLHHETGSLRPGPAPAVPAKVGPLRSSLIGRDAVREQPSQAEVTGHGYAWVDRDAGIVSVPLEVAFDVYVRQQVDAARGDLR